MPTPLQSIIAAGTKLWLDSVDPELVTHAFDQGATGATSNPIIVSDIIKAGGFDDRIAQHIDEGLDDDAIAWALTDHLVQSAQDVFLPVWERTKGNDGYVSFELDPLLEDAELGPPHDERVARYIELGKRWAHGRPNRMIKVPATPAGLDALEELAAAGVSLNVTLIFSPRQYEAARDAIWRGAQRRASLDLFKSVYSIFISRVDVYSEKHLPDLSPAAQGWVGLVNVKRMWRDNETYWSQPPRDALPLQQELVFASTGTKKPDDPKDKYIAELVGSGIQTNPPAINDAVDATGKTYARSVDRLPESALGEIDRAVDMDHLEQTLLTEGLKKFADPQKALIELIGEKRAALASAG